MLLTFSRCICFVRDVIEIFLLEILNKKCDCCHVMLLFEPMREISATNKLEAAVSICIFTSWR